MANYTKTVNFAAKDALVSGNPLKRISGVEVNTEFDNIASAISTKLDITSFLPDTPTGSLAFWPSASTPTGWLICDGQAVSRTTYQSLFGVIGIFFGAGDGSTTFNLPNYTNRMAVSAGGLYSIGIPAGSKDSILVSHTHSTSVTNTSHSHVVGPMDVWRGAAAGNTSAAWGGGDRQDATNVSKIFTNAVTNASVSNSTEGVSGTDRNMPPYLGMRFMIKAT